MASKKWHRPIYLQSRNRDRYREQMHGPQWGEGGGGTNWEIDIDSIMYKITSENLLYSTGNATQCYVAT